MDSGKQAYAIVRPVLSFSASDAIDIGHDRYEAIVESSRLIALVIEIEERFDMLVKSLEEFEGELLRQALKASLYHEYEALTEDRRDQNRRLMTVLAVGRMYRDQLRSDFSVIFGRESEEWKTIDRAFRREYDTRPGYRVMEALRNTAQHKTLPIKSLTSDARVDDHAEAHAVIFRMIPRLDVADLNRAKLKAAVLEGDLEPAADARGEVDMLPLLLDWIEGKSVVHEQARALLADKRRAAANVIQAVREDAIGEWGDPEGRKPVAIAVLREDGTQRECHSVVDEQLDRLESLERRNASHRHVGRLQVALK